MDVRTARSVDFDGYLRLFDEVAAEGMWIGTESPVDGEHIRSLFDATLTDPDATMFVAGEGSDVAGSIFLRSTGGVVGLGMMVAARERGRGVGRSLLDAGVAWAESIDAHKLALEVWPHNRAAMGLYLASGFVVEGRLRRHHRRRSGQLWDAVVMGRALDLTSPGSPHDDELGPDGS